MPAYDIYYRKTPTFRLDEDLYISDVIGGKSFVKVGTFDFHTRANLFGGMQAEFMLPKVLAKIRLIQENPKTKIHTSISVGDVIHELYPGKFFQCDNIGWKRIRY